MLEQFHDANVIADKGYDSNALIELIEAQGCKAIIPARSCRKAGRELDRYLYKERFLVEYFFQRIKRNRRIAMRFEKLAAHYLAMVMLAAILLWIL